MPWRDLIVHNFWWKVTSLILATFIWFTVIWVTGRSGDLGIRGPESLVNVTRTHNFTRHPVSILVPSNESRSFRVEPAYVDITVSGELTDIENLNWKDVRAFVDALTFEGRLTTNRVQVSIPPRLKIEKVTPPEARLVLVPLDRDRPLTNNPAAPQPVANPNP